MMEITFIINKYVHMYNLLTNIKFHKEIVRNLFIQLIYNILFKILYTKKIHHLFIKIQNLGIKFIKI